MQPQDPDVEQLLPGIEILTVDQPKEAKVTPTTGSLSLDGKSSQKPPTLARYITCTFVFLVLAWLILSIAVVFVTFSMIGTITLGHTLIQIGLRLYNFYATGTPFSLPGMETDLLITFALIGASGSTILVVVGLNILCGFMAVYGINRIRKGKHFSSEPQLSLREKIKQKAQGSTAKQLSWTRRFVHILPNAVVGPLGIAALHFWREEALSGPLVSGEVVVGYWYAAVAGLLGRVTAFGLHWVYRRMRPCPEKVAPEELVAEEAQKFNAEAADKA